MNVSFGKIKILHYKKTLTDKQQATADIAIHLFSAKKGQNICTHKILHKKFNSDILITQLANGDTRISVVSSTKEGKPKIKIPPLSINNKLYLMKIYTQIENYVKLCKYAMENS